MKTSRHLPKAIIAILKGLTPTEIKEVAHFALFLKTRASVDPSQLYFWTRTWQSREQAAGRDKRLGRLIGDGTPGGLIASLQK